jgi:hypothetical protein
MFPQLSYIIQQNQKNKLKGKHKTHSMPPKTTKTPISMHKHCYIDYFSHS